MAILKNGTYYGTASGHNSLIEVSVTFKDNKIKDVEVTDQKETGNGHLALKKIPQEIVKNQSVKIDTVSEATFTSKAIIEAVKKCIKQAGGDASNFSKIKE